MMRSCNPADAGMAPGAQLRAGRRTHAQLLRSAFRWTPTRSALDTRTAPGRRGCQPSVDLTYPVKNSILKLRPGAASGSRRAQADALSTPTADDGVIVRELHGEVVRDLPRVGRNTQMRSVEALEAVSRTP